MTYEIERRFLVNGDGWRAQADEGVAYRQGYMVSDRKKTVRVRVLEDRGLLTIKGPGGLTRVELEYEIDRADAEYMLMLCDERIEKTRFRVQYEGLLWEVDLFGGANEGLVMAEVELASEEQKIELPEWISEEVTDDARYFNACLARHPFSTW